MLDVRLDLPTELHPVPGSLRPVEDKSRGRVSEAQTTLEDQVHFDALVLLVQRVEVNRCMSGFIDRHLAAEGSRWCGAAWKWEQRA